MILDPWDKECLVAVRALWRTSVSVFQGEDAIFEDADSIRDRGEY